MNNAYEILDKCLLEIEQGADVDTVLFRYPEFADELRPVLEASVKAKGLAAPAPSVDVVRRNRARVLQRAAELREARVKPSSRIWLASLRRVAVTVAVVLMLFVSGTGLVRASSNTIPGDNLYPVKRTWEDVLLLFTFNSQAREQLEFDHENERLEELDELFTEGRSAKVDFAGYVTRQDGNEWRVSNITVVLSTQTVLPNQPVKVGDGVRVVGRTQSDKTVLAERVEILPVGSKLPEVEDDEPEIEQENSNGSKPDMEDNSNSGSENESPQTKVTETPKNESESKKESFTGTLEILDKKNQVWTVGGQKMDVRGAEIKGTPTIGASVKVEGYFGAGGIFIVTKIEILGGSDSINDSNDNNGDNSNENNDSNDNNGNENSNSDNGNDSHGGNSGSGGGGNGNDD